MAKAGLTCSIIGLSLFGAYVLFIIVTMLL